MTINDYELQTTFWQDFSIADAFGENAIEDTFNRAFNEWKSNVTYLTELAFVLNHKCWYWLDKNDAYMELYRRLYYKAYEYGLDNLKGADFRYFWSTLD